MSQKIWNHRAIISKTAISRIAFDNHLVVGEIDATPGNKCYRGAYSRVRPTCVERDQAEAPGFDAPWLTANFLKTKHRFYKQVQEELIVACDYLLYTLFISFRLFLTYIISQSYFSLSKVACFRRLHNTARVITVCASLFIHSKAACLETK